MLIDFCKILRMNLIWIVGWRLIIIYEFVTVDSILNHRIRSILVGIFIGCVDNIVLYCRLFILTVCFIQIIDMILLYFSLGFLYNFLTLNMTVINVLSNIFPILSCSLSNLVHIRFIGLFHGFHNNRICELLCYI